MQQEVVLASDFDVGHPHKYPKNNYCGSMKFCRPSTQNGFKHVSLLVIK